MLKVKEIGLGRRHSPLVAILLHFMVKIDLDQNNLIIFLSNSNDPTKIFFGADSAIRVVVLAEEKEDLHSIR